MNELQYTEARLIRVVVVRRRYGHLWTFRSQVPDCEFDVDRVYFVTRCWSTSSQCCCKYWCIAHRISSRMRYTIIVIHTLTN